MSKNELSQQLFPETMFQKERIEENFQADDFDFNVFIENLTYKTMNHIKSYRKSDELNSPPIQTNDSEDVVPIHNFHLHTGLLLDLFESSMCKLHEIYGSIKEEEELLKDETKLRLKEQKEKLSHLSGELEDIGKGFRSLEDFMNQVGNTTVQIGSTLEQTDIQKQKALETKELLNYFSEFNRYDDLQFKREIISGRKVLVFEVFRDPDRKMEAVRILKQLSALIPDLKGISDCENGIANISAYKSYVLENMLREFSLALVDEVDRQVMKQLSAMAKVFQEFDTVEDCMRLYTNRRFDIFLGIDDKEYISLPESESKVTLSSKPILMPTEDTKKDKKLDSTDDKDVRVDATSSQEEDIPVQTEEEIIDEKIRRRREEKRSRANHLDWQRNKKMTDIGFSIRSVSSFNQLLENFEKLLLDESDVIKHVFPNTIQDTTSMFIKMFMRLIKSFLSSDWMQPPAAISQSNSYLQSLESVYSSITAFVGRLVTSELMVNEEDIRQEIDNLFTEKKNIYCQLEIKYLNNHALLALNEQKLNIASELPSEKKKSGVLSFSSTASQGFGFQTVDTELDCFVVLNVMYENVYALQRCKKLLEGKDLQPTCAKDIFSVLVSFVFRYVSDGISTGQRKILGERANPTEVSVGKEVFAIIGITDVLLQNIRKHFENEVLPQVSSNIQMNNECIHLKDDLFTRLETQVVGLLKDMCSNIVVMADNILLTKQKKSDYATTNLNETFTPACKKWCDFISEQLGYIEHALHNDNREQFLTVLGNQLFKCLVRHLATRCGTISSESVRFLRDMNQYYQCILKFKIEKVEKQFKVFAALGKIMLMPPDNISELLKSFDLSYISKADLLSILKLRSDAKQMKNFFQTNFQSK